MDVVVQWFLGLGERYGVNPIVFRAIYVGAIPFFWLSVGWLFRRLRRGQSIVAPSLSAGFCFVSAYIYLILAGRNVPVWVYGVVVLLIAGSGWSTVRSLRARSREARVEAATAGAASIDPAGAAPIGPAGAASIDPVKEFDLVVIGGGAAGLTAAGMGGQFAARTLLVEAGRLGGDCTWTGCVPSKALLKAASVAQSMRTADRHGLTAMEPAVDLDKVLGRVREIQQEIYHDADRPEIYEKLGVEVCFATARFTGPHALELRAEGRPGRLVRFRHAVIAAGSRPAVPPIPGLDTVSYLTNETLFDLKRLPGHLAVLGGGPIGIEMAQAFRRLGARVTVLEQGEHILPRDDPELTDILQSRIEAEGVEFHLGARVTRVECAGSGVHLHVEGESSPPARIEADALLVAAGRVAETGSLGLDAAGIEATPRGIQIDDRCRTSRRHIFACGDVAGGLQLTHVAEHMAKVAVTNALLRIPMKMDRTAVPRATFTDPELAHVGATIDELETTGRPYRVYRFPFSKIDRALTDGAPHGWIKVLATRHTGRILGAGVVGESAGEMIAELGLALRQRIPLRKIADTIHAYPTLALGNRRVADQWYIQNASPTLVRIIKMMWGLRGVVPPSPDRNRIV